MSDDHGHGTFVKDGVTIMPETAVEAVNLAASGWQEKKTKATTSKSDSKTDDK